jgi:hypothetical protein
MGEAADTGANARAPLHPLALALASFVLAPFGTGIALSVNDARLGAKNRAPLTFYLFFFVALIAYLVLARLHTERVVSFGSKAGWLFARAVLGWLALMLAFVWSRPMRARYQAALNAGVRPGNPLPVCMPALLASVTLDVFVWQLFMRT